MKIKIIFCLHHFLPDFIAGTEIYTLRLAQRLSRNGLEVAVLIPNFGSVTDDEYEFEGVRVIRYAENSVADRKMIMGSIKPNGLPAFVEILKSEKPHIVHFHELAPGEGPGIFHVRAVRKLDIPVVLTFHLSGYSCFKGSLIYKDIEKCDGIIQIKKCTECIYYAKKFTGVKAKLLAATALAFFKMGVNGMHLNSSFGTAIGFPFVVSKLKADLYELSDLAGKIVVLTNWYRQMLEKNGVPAEKLIYIKQGLTGEMQKSFTCSEISYPLKIVFVGRITPLKGLHLLLDAISKLHEEKISLHIYGQETEDGYTLECKQKSTGKKNIHWMGTIPAEEVIPTLSNYHVLCLPSTFSEMSPLVIQEAFAAGLPVIASDVYGNAEQIKEGVNGWLFRFQDSEQLAEKLRSLTGDLGMVEKARKNFPEMHGFEDIAKKHIELYSEMIISPEKFTVGYLN